MVMKSTVSAVCSQRPSASALNLIGWTTSSTLVTNQTFFGSPLSVPSTSFFFRVSITWFSTFTSSVPTPAIEPCGFSLRPLCLSSRVFFTPDIIRSFLLALFHIP